MANAPHVCHPDFFAGSHTASVTSRMIRLLDQLKQGLRRIGRGRLEVPGGVPTVSQVNDWGQATRLRTELDDAPSSLDKRLTPTTPPAGPPSGRTRKAILSKARRTARTQSALSFWGLAPVASADESGDLAKIAPASMLAGSSLLQPSTAAAGARRDRPLGLLGAATSFGELQEVAVPQPLLEPAPPLSGKDDATDRPTWP